MPGSENKINLYLVAGIMHVIIGSFMLGVMSIN